MGKLYKTSKGKIIDMDALRVQSENSPAIGNMNVNGRGDKLGRGGKVVERAEEKTRAYYKENPRAVKRVDIKDDIKQPTSTAPAEDIENLAANLDKSKDSKKETKKSSKKETKTIDKSKEVELEDGSIIIKDGDDDEG